MATDTGFYARLSVIIFLISLSAAALAQKSAASKPVNALDAASDGRRNTPALKVQLSPRIRVGLLQFSLQQHQSSTLSFDKAHTQREHNNARGAATSHAPWRQPVKFINGDEQDYDEADVVDMDLHSAQSLCDRNLLHLLPVNKLPSALDSTSVRDDFVMNTLQPCAVGHSLSSTVMVFSENTNSGNRQPAINADFFDTTNFPGKRAIRRSPVYLAEWALLAHGISTDQLYTTLDQPDQAWPLIRYALDSLDDDILWVDTDAQAIGALTSGRAAFAISDSREVLKSNWQGAADAHTGLANAALEIMWHTPINQTRAWVIPSHSGNFPAAWSFIQQASDPIVNGKFATGSGIGPTRKSALRLVASQYRRLLPSDVANLRSAVRYNARWWQNNYALYQERFDRWLLAEPQLSNSATKNSRRNKSNWRVQLRPTQTRPAKPRHPTTRSPEPQSL